MEGFKISLNLNHENLTEDQHLILNLTNGYSNNRKLKKLTEEYIQITDGDKKFVELKEKTKKEVSERLAKECDSFGKEKDIIYVDGVFDIMHSGHFNAIRQAKKLGDTLIVGVNIDEEVQKVKGPTLMNDEERTLLADSVKWVDRTETLTPYTTTVSFLNKIGATHAAHGDDIAVNEKGENAYQELIDAGKFKIFKRTEGISTTNLLGRLMMIGSSENDNKFYKPLVGNYLPTGWRFKEFCNDKNPKSDDVIVYIDGAFDCLHPGHIKALKLAKEKGTFVYVGLYDDGACEQVYGKSNPVMGLMERASNLLSLKYVDDIVIGVPRKVNEDMLKSLGIHKVLAEEIYNQTENDQYEAPKKMGILEYFNVTPKLNNQFFIDRINKNKEVFIDKYMKKSKKEEEYEKNKSYNKKEV